MIIGLVHVIIVIVTVMFILNFVHCEITACDSDNKQSYLILKTGALKSTLMGTKQLTMSNSHSN